MNVFKPVRGTVITACLVAGILFISGCRIEKDKSDRTSTHTG